MSEAALHQFLASRFLRPFKTMPNTSSKTTDIAVAAKKLLGFESLLSVQREAIQSLLEGRNTLLAQPAGSSTSAVYTIAGALMEGTTVIVSPAIADESDQADASEARHVAEVMAIFSESERQEILGRISAGKVEYLFLTPEQLREPETMQRLKDANVSLLAIDEANCISQWGHDFRPDYLGLAQVIEELGHPPVLALAGAASRDVREDIIARLGLNSPRVMAHGFDRPNISLRVDLFSTKDEKWQSLLRRVEFADKPGIVYASTHKNAESIATDLAQIGVPAVYYHGGLKAREREDAKNRFVSGEVPVMVATNALGLDLDMPDIRFVYHADASDSLDAYYQELSHAGHDGEPAEAVLFYRPQEISAQNFKTGGVRVDSAALESVYNALLKRKRPISREELSVASTFSVRKLVGLLHKLEETGAIVQVDSGEIRATSNRPLSEVIDAAERQQQAQKENRNRRLQQMQQYAECRRCRRELLLQYLGDNLNEPCGNCDRCEERGVLAKVA